MKTTMKLLIAGLAITSQFTCFALDIVDYNYYGDLGKTNQICSNDNVTVEVMFDSAPRGGDIVTVALKDGTKLEFYTKFKTTTQSTRCGVGINHSAGLKWHLGNIVAKGKISLNTGGADCGFVHTSASLNLEVAEENINVHITCK
jgi:hypothetical protein